VAHVHQPQLGREIPISRREIVEIPLEILLKIWLGLGLG